MLEQTGGKRVPKTMRVIIHAYPEQTIECPLPVCQRGFGVTVITPEEAIAIQFFDFGSGIKHNIWQWNVTPASFVRRVELQITDADFEAATDHGPSDAEPGMPEQ